MPTSRTTKITDHEEQNDNEKPEKIGTCEIRDNLIDETAIL